MLIETRIFNQPNGVVRSFDMQSKLVLEDDDSPRDKLIGEYLKDFHFASRPKDVLEKLKEYPDLPVALMLKRLGFGYWWPNQANLESITNTEHHVIVCKDFSLLIAGWATIGAWASVFHFIDSNGYENYADDHPVHELVERVRRRFGCEHVMYWAKQAAVK